MALERIDTGAEPSDELTWSDRQMSEVIRERDQYRQALYEATNARLLDSNKAVEALSVVDQLHRDCHTVSKERDRAILQVEDADEILDSPLRTIRFGVGVITQVVRERLSARRQRRQPLYRREHRLPRRGSI